MALQLLDGTDATVDLLVAISGTSGSSLRCVTTDIDHSATRQFQEALTLCSGNWVDELPGRRQEFLSVGRLASKGAVISDLGPLMGATAAANVTFSLATGCSRTGTFWMDSESNRVSAGNVAIPGRVTLRSRGAVANAWVTA